MFIHGGWLHILGNMLFLWVFGDNIEDRFGHVRFFVFYLAAGVAAVGAQVAINPDSQAPMIGASGAIAGVLGAYIMLFPRARVLTFVPILFLPWMLEIPAVVYLGVWFFSQFSNGMTGTSIAVGGGIAYWAHVGGFAAGFVMVRRFSRRMQSVRLHRPPENGSSVS